MIHGCHIKLLANLLKVEIPWSLSPWKYECSKQDTKAYLELYQTSKMERFANILDGWKALTIFTKRTILYVWEANKTRINKCFFSTIHDRTTRLYRKCYYLALQKIETSINYDYLTKNRELIWITWIHLFNYLHRVSFWNTKFREP